MFRRDAHSTCKHRHRRRVTWLCSCIAKKKKISLEAMLPPHAAETQSTSQGSATTQPMQIFKNVMHSLHTTWNTASESDGPRHCLATVNIPKVMLSLHADKAPLMSHRLCHCSANVNIQKVMLCRQSTVDNNRLCHCSAIVNIQEVMLLLHANWIADDESHCSATA